MKGTVMTKPEPRVKLKAGSSFVRIRPFFSFDSKHIFLAAGNDIKVVSVASGQYVKQLSGHDAPVVGLQANPQNYTQLISCSRDGTVITWDYTDGIALKKYKIDADEVVAFYAPARNKPLYCIQFQSKRKDFQLRSFTLDRPKSRFILQNVVPAEHAVAFGAQGRLVSSVNGQSLRIFDLEKSLLKKHMNQVQMVCVACHPTEYVVATGDETGRIIVWNNIFDHQNICRSVYHWHTLPFGDLCFSAEGFYLYSGGGECVLVKWNLQREYQEFAPRLGMPICHLAVAPDNRYLAISHMDNAVSLVTPQLQVVQYIQGLSQGHPWSCPGQLVAPTGLVHDPRSRALVLSGRPGHLQFYSLTSDKQLFSLDVVGQNFLTQERNRTIYNTQVEKADLDSTGLWMATVQRFDDGQTTPDISLKVWKYNGQLQTYSLNTTVLLPHNHKVNCLRFRPTVENQAPLFVTTSDDLKFKTWNLEITEEGTTTFESWVCESLGHFRKYCPSEASFKQDGSLLAVAFDWTVTLWSPSPLVLKGNLSHPLYKSHFRQVVFGQGECCHLVATCSEERLSVWNSSTQSLQWTAEFSVARLAADPLSEHMAAFGRDHTLFVFKPSCGQPCFVKAEVSSSEVIAAAFIPHAQEEVKGPRLEWQRQSQLYFLNTKQELLTVVEDDCDPDLNIEEEVDNMEVSKALRVLPGTSFASLVAQQRASGLVASTDTLQHFHTTQGLVGAKEVKELMEIPAHVMPPLRTLCGQFMRALLIPKED